jgi:transmembrane protein TMEM174 (potassium channel)
MGDNDDVDVRRPGNLAGGSRRLRLRGLEMTRIETFTDAAFAFAVAFLVISTASAHSFQELRQALVGTPAFAVSFVLIMVFWVGHWKWSRRYGQEDMPVIMLSGRIHKYGGIRPPMHRRRLRCAVPGVRLSRAPCRRRASAASVRHRIYELDH